MKTYIAREQFDLVLARFEDRLTITRQTGYTRVEGPTGRRIYVPNTKLVGKCDFSCFEVDPNVFGVRGVEGNGNVKQELRFDRPAEEILVDFECLVEHMLTLSPVAPKVKKMKATSEGKAAVIDTEKLEAARVARMALIQKVAEEKGVAVSK